MPGCPGGDSCCTPERKCSENEGHCNSDDDCKPGLSCGENNCRKQRGLQLSRWFDTLQWTDNCCEKRGKKYWIT